MQHIAEFFKLHSSPHWTFGYCPHSVIFVCVCVTACMQMFPCVYLLYKTCDVNNVQGVFLWPSVLTLSTCNIIIRLQLQKLPTSKASFALTHEVPASWRRSSYTMWSGIFLPHALRKEAVIDPESWTGYQWP